MRFLNWDGTQDVPYGEAAEAPEAPNRPFHTFLCWDRDFSKITRPVDEMTKQGKTIWAQGHKKQPHALPWAVALPAGSDAAGLSWRINIWPIRLQAALRR